MVHAFFQEERSQGQTTPNLYHKLEQAMIDAENSKKNEESVTRWRDEEDAVEALHKVYIFLNSFFYFPFFLGKKTTLYSRLEQKLFY